MCVCVCVGGGGGGWLKELGVTICMVVGAGLSVTCISGITVVLASLSAVVDLACLVVGIPLVVDSEV